MAEYLKLEEHPTKPKDRGVRHRERMLRNYRNAPLSIGLRYLTQTRANHHMEE